MIKYISEETLKQILESNVVICNEIMDGKIKAINNLISEVRKKDVNYDLNDAGNKIRNHFGIPHPVKKEPVNASMVFEMPFIMSSYENTGTPYKKDGNWCLSSEIEITTKITIDPFNKEHRERLEELIKREVNNILKIIDNNIIKT